MTEEQFDLMKIISTIGNWHDNTERIEYYETYKDILQDYSMIFVDNVFADTKNSILEKIAELNYDCNSLFASNNLLVLNKKVLANKDRRKNTLLKFQFCIQFDLNIISQLKNFNNPEFKDEELEKIINLCRSGTTAFDAMNFVIENYMKDKNNLGLNQHDLEDIRAFETMFPHKRFSYDRGIPINTRMQQLTNYYNSDDCKKTVQDFYDEIYLHELTYLLAIVHIHFKYFKLSPDHKFEKFLDFCNNTLNAFYPCACNLAKLFYDNTKLRFFKKIEKNNTHIIETLENMAWDLFHIKFLEKSEEFSHDDTEVIMIPIFISKDKGLNEIRKAYQVKCMFKNLKTGICIPFYNMITTATREYQEKYFTKEEVLRRENSTHDLKQNSEMLKNLILQDIHN